MKFIFVGFHLFFIYQFSLTLSYVFISNELLILKKIEYIFITIVYTNFTNKNCFETVPSFICG